jgi:hypothetical protein
LHLVGEVVGFAEVGEVLLALPDCLRLLWSVVILMKAGNGKINMVEGTAKNVIAEICDP